MPDASHPPRLAFVGLGWMGRHRLQAVAGSGLAEIVGVCDADAAAAAEARAAAPAARVGTTLDDALSLAPDGVVIATPSSLHAAQTIQALEAGAAVFCQKPLGRTAGEVVAVIDAARHANRLLAVDWSYRFTTGLRLVHEAVRSGALGDVFAIDLVFHNAYGPDKAWFYDTRQSGGGCLLDLGTHLVDFVHWTFAEPAVRVAGQLYASGRRLPPGPAVVEDYACGEIELASGAVARLACSWRVSAGCDAHIAITAFGTRGGAAFRNVNGSFYDFVAERYRGTARETLCAPPDAWGGRAIVSWVQQLSASATYDARIETAAAVAETLDRLYGRAPATRPADAPGAVPAASR